MGTGCGRLARHPFQGSNIGGNGLHAIPRHRAEGLGGRTDREAPHWARRGAVRVNLVDAPVVGAIGQGARIEGGCGLITL